MMLEYGKMLERAGAVVQFRHNQGEVKYLWYILKVKCQGCGTDILKGIAERYSSS